MNPDFSNSSKQSNNYYKYNQQSGYGAMQNQFNPQANNNFVNNPYGGYLPEQYQNVYYNPYSYQAGGQNAYPYNYNFQGQQNQVMNSFDQTGNTTNTNTTINSNTNANANVNAQYQQMLLNTLSANQQFSQTGGNIQNQTQNQNTNNQIQGADLTNQYQAQMGGYMIPGYGYDLNQMNMIQMTQDQMSIQNTDEEKKPSDEKTDN